MRQMQNKGLVGILVIIILAIISLSYFNIDLEKELQKPETKQGIEYASKEGTTFWKTYLEKPLTDAWNKIIVGGLWDEFMKSVNETSLPPMPTIEAPEPTQS